MLVSETGSSGDFDEFGEEGNEWMEGNQYAEVHQEGCFNSCNCEKL